MFSPSTLFKLHPLWVRCVGRGGGTTGLIWYDLCNKHRAELRERTRRRNETADEFAENLKNLAQRAYTNDNLVVERFREGHGNVELKKHLCLYPSTGLQDLIDACVFISFMAYCLILCVVSICIVHITVIIRSVHIGHKWETLSLFFVRVMGMLYGRVQ